MRCQLAAACLLLASSAAPTDLTLDGVVYVSRHGVRAPYGPIVDAAGTAAANDDWSAWTSKAAKNAEDYGMDADAFAAQELTPHGMALMPLLGSYVADRWRALGLDVGGDWAVFADDSTRDWQTAALWLEGAGRGDVPVRVGNASLPNLIPVLSDSVLYGAGADATEEQTLGLFGGDVAALTAAYEDDMADIGRALGFADDAPICAALGVADDCAIANLPYKFTGIYWQGMFTCPLYYAQFFAEAWMFEYLSGVDDFAFGALTGSEVAKLYDVVALFVHDTNQLYLRKLLGLQWIARGWQGNAASTGGALSFELHCAGTQGAADRRCFVKTRYTVASPRQQREATVLDATTPPSEAVLVLPGCGVELCPLAAFVGVVLDAVCFDCVGDPVRTVLGRLADHAAEPPAEEACDAAPAWQQALSLLGAAAFGASLALFVAWCLRVRRHRRARQAPSLLGASRQAPAGERLTLVESGTVL
ncbi:expressed protein [Aureococcus anophagefferens]|uniref:Expressed protein n=1 Tax=Aureococcus anophagefferens TaxID=44056 RepID=F0YPD2_AURAN|nr:expressed protein [Aureococcus anophagefferens]EGB03031.1 expressed protein [Aureococcus anophagefferens]|eukprot:XP_009042272.1 expressed protein [Aureococcus anophagefferens]